MLDKLNSKYFFVRNTVILTHMNHIKLYECVENLRNVLSQVTIFRMINLFSTDVKHRPNWLNL